MDGPAVLLTIWGFIFSSTTAESDCEVVRLVFTSLMDDRSQGAQNFIEINLPQCQKSLLENVISWIDAIQRELRIFC